jgi:hypothetical protein
VIVLNLDGKEQPTLANFAPLLASAGLLGEFFNQKEGSEVAMDALLSAARLSNDLMFRKKAEEARARMSGAAPDSDDFKRFKSELDTFNRNITEPRLQLAASA